MKRQLKRLLVGLLRRLVTTEFLAPMVNEIRLNTPLIWRDATRVDIHPTAEIHNALLNTSSGRIDIEEFVSFGHNVSLLTGTHDVDKFNEARLHEVPLEGHNIVIRRGAWIASNATIIGPCEVGEHAVVAAGSVVTKDVAPFQLVAVVPSKLIRSIQGASARTKQ